MEQPIEDLQDAAQKVANVYSRLANKHFSCNLPVPARIEFDLCDRSPKSAGQASPLMVIAINMILFRDNVKHILNDTIPHEIGHLVQFDRFDNRGSHVQGHGAEWQAIMKKFGKDPHKYHNMDTTEAVAHYKGRKKRKKSEAS